MLHRPLEHGEEAAVEVPGAFWRCQPTGKLPDGNAAVGRAVLSERSRGGGVGCSTGSDFGGVSDRF
jgi:hypothetical protein